MSEYIDMHVCLRTYPRPHVQIYM